MCSAIFISMHTCTRIPYKRIRNNEEWYDIISNFLFSDIRDNIGFVSYNEQILWLYSEGEVDLDSGSKVKTRVTLTKTVCVVESSSWSTFSSLEINATHWCLTVFFIILSFRDGRFLFRIKESRVIGLRQSNNNAIDTIISTDFFSPSPLLVL